MSPSFPILQALCLLCAAHSLGSSSNKKREKCRAAKAATLAPGPGRAVLPLTRVLRSPLQAGLSLESRCCCCSPRGYWTRWPTSSAHCCCPVQVVMSSAWQEAGGGDLDSSSFRWDSPRTRHGPQSPRVPGPGWSLKCEDRRGRCQLCLTWLPGAVPEAATDPGSHRQWVSQLPGRTWTLGLSQFSPGFFRSKGTVGLGGGRHHLTAGPGAWMCGSVLVCL